MVERLSDYQFSLPEELIARYPVTPRDHSRLLVVDRSQSTFQEFPFYELPTILNSGDHLVFNDTKVIPARLKGVRSTGGAAEIFLHKEKQPSVWEVLAKPARKLSVGATITFSETFSCVVLERGIEGSCLVKFNHEEPLSHLLEKYGTIPLPPYIQRDVEDQDKKNYQTIYAKSSGAVAAPTAGLHFTERVFNKLEDKQIKKSYLTLHVGLGTFKPVTVDRIHDHKMHSERVIISKETAEKLNDSSKVSRRIAVGTTSCRALESAASSERVIVPGDFETDIFMYPGYQFKCTDALLTNFHLPGSTLLMLVSAFAGYELMMEAYRKAVMDRFRFFSYGDAMLIL